MSGIIYSDSGKIVVNDILLSKNNFDKFIIKISTILDDIDNQFICDKVQDELEFPLVNLGYSKKEIKNRIVEVSNIVKISTILGKKVFKLSDVEKIKVLIAASIIHKPALLLIDDIFRFINLK